MAAARKLPSPLFQSLEELVLAVRDEAPVARRRLLCMQLFDPRSRRQGGSGLRGFFVPPLLCSSEEALAASKHGEVLCRFEGLSMGEADALLAASEHSLFLCLRHLHTLHRAGLAFTSARALLDDEAEAAAASATAEPEDAELAAENEAWRTVGGSVEEKLQLPSNVRVWTAAELALCFPLHGVIMELEAASARKADLRLRNALQLVDAVFHGLIHYLHQSTNRFRPRKEDESLRRAVQAVRLHGDIDPNEMLRQGVMRRMRMPNSDLRRAVHRAVTLALQKAQAKLIDLHEQHNTRGAWKGVVFEIFMNEIGSCQWLRLLPQSIVDTVTEIADAQQRHALLEMVLRVHYIFKQKMPWDNRAKDLSKRKLHSVIAEALLLQVDALLEQARAQLAGEGSSVAVPPPEHALSSVPTNEEMAASYTQGLSSPYALRTLQCSKLANGARLLSDKSSARLPTLVRSHGWQQFCQRLAEVIDVSELRGSRS